MKFVLSLNPNCISSIIDSIMIGPKNWENSTIKVALDLLILNELNGNRIYINNSDGKIN
jgi:hypothetical protein